MMTHIVMFRLNDPDDVPEVVGRLSAMQGQIPSLLNIEVGENSHEGPAAHDLVLVTSHAHVAGLRQYVEHPVHQDVVAWLEPLIRERAVVDTHDLG